VKEKALMKKIIIIAAVVVLLAGGGAAAYFMLGKDSAVPALDADGQPIPQAAAAEPVEEEKDAIYLGLDPAFVVNFERNGTIRYLQLSLQVMSFEQSAIDKVAANMPAVRNTLILLLSAQDYDSLATLEGKENLRSQVLDSVNKVVRLKGDTKVNEVFFTGFVIQ
jgi:flagellar FliL protein